MTFHLCSIDAIPEGQMKTVEVDGLPTLLVCNVGGTFYAVASTCSHGSVDLGEGRLLGCEVECPLHAGRFDVTTGEATRRPAKKPVSTFSCLVQDDELYLDATGDVRVA